VNPPELTRHDLEAQVGRLLAAGRKRYLFAFHGRGADDVLEVEGARVRIVPVRSELDLRRRLLEIPHDEYAAILIPWRATAVPIDLQGRFARDGRIELVGRAERLKTRFGVTEVDDDARDCPLAEYVLAHHPTDAFAIGAARLTLDALWTAYLATAWRLDAGGELALDALLGWAAADGGGARFAAVIAERGAGAVRDALLAHLDKKLGPAAVVVWRAWEAGRGAAALELALGLDALAGVTDGVATMWRRMECVKVFGAEPAPAVLAQLAAAADPALRFLARPGQGDAALVRSIVRASDQRVATPELAPFLAGSSRLPSAWRARLDRLGAALAAVAATPTAATVRAAVAAWELAWRHEMAQDPDHAPVLRRTQMALRLASWLASRTDRDLPPAATEYGDVEQLAGWYAREGGYVDRARRWARGGRDGEFAAGVMAVVDAVDHERTMLDRRFARALPAWHRAGRRATQVVPIDQALERIAIRFLDEDPERKLLVILMDGMAWAQATELLESMGDRASVWGPLAWHAMASHRIGDAPFPPVLTNFPTLTEVSRSGFFGSKAIPAGAPTDASKDAARWKDNRLVKKHVDASVVPQLRLRGDGQAKDGSALPEALEMVRDPAQRIVGVVLNAIDMSLKADRAHETAWTLDTVKALRELLDKATEAGRAVLLCSDHGHVPADRMEGTRAPMRDGARWRTWATESEPLADYEIGLAASEGVWAPRGAHGVALLADDTYRHGGGTGSGEHGGASLAEVVAPCVLIGCADVPAATDDAGQGVRPATAPSWWFFDVGEAAPEPAADDRTRKPKKPTKRPPETQTTMFAPPPAPTPPAAPTPSGAPSADSSPLAASELFKARATDAKARQQALRAVEFLRARRGIAGAAAFAAELGEFAARVGGVVAKLQEILNVDGYQVVRFDRQTQQVHLDLEKLAQQFDVSF
jgi:hypothetical protein